MKSADLVKHIETIHQQKTRKRSKATFTCTGHQCDSTFDTSETLKLHMESQHITVMNDDNSKARPPCSTPPRKKFEQESNR